MRDHLQSICGCLSARAVAVASFMAARLLAADQPTPREGESSGSSIPPFLAQGLVSAKPDESTATFSFAWSNGWWRVQITQAHPLNSGPVLQDCMKVPDGVRHYVLFAKEAPAALTSATVCPNAYPPAGLAGGMFQCWLSLCPYPELPLVDGRRMHRFLNLPTCQPELTNDSRDEADYALGYLMPGHAFLSELSLTNNGTWLDLTEKSDFAFIQYGGALQAGGFPEMEYRLLETTNVGGILFPRLATVSYPGLGLVEPAGRNEREAHWVVKISVTNILLHGGFEGPAAPAKLFAMDYRYPRFSSAGRPFNPYLGSVITNDSWQAARPLDRTLRLLPPAEELGPGWSRELGLRFDPAGSEPELLPRSHAIPEAVRDARSALADTIGGPIEVWANGQFHLLRANQRSSYEVQIQRYASRRQLRKDFALLSTGRDDSAVTMSKLEGVGTEAVVFHDTVHHRLTLWFFHGDYLVWITPLGASLPPSWQDNIPLQDLARAILRRAA